MQVIAVRPAFFYYRSVCDPAFSGGLMCVRVRGGGDWRYCNLIGDACM